MVRTFARPHVRAAVKSQRHILGCISDVEFWPHVDSPCAGRAAPLPAPQNPHTSHVARTRSYETYVVGSGQMQIVRHSTPSTFPRRGDRVDTRRAATRGAALATHKAFLQNLKKRI